MSNDPNHDSSHDSFPVTATAMGAASGGMVIGGVHFLRAGALLAGGLWLGVGCLALGGLAALVMARFEKRI